MRLAGSTLQLKRGTRQKMSVAVLHCFLTSAILPRIETDLAASEVAILKKKGCSPRFERTS
jgi:hypothetical protein